MTIEELQEAVRKNRSHGLQRLMLVITRKNPPRSEYARVKGIGKGYVCNAGEREDGLWNWVVQVELADVERALAANGTPA